MDDRSSPTLDSAAPPESTTAEAIPTPTLDRLASQQRAALLQQLTDPALMTLLRGQLNEAFSAAALRELQLTKPMATAIRQQLVEQGYLSVRKDGRKATYALTEAGRAYLDTLDRPELTPKRGRGPTVVDESSIPEELRRYRRAALLQQLTDPAMATRTGGQLNDAFGAGALRELQLTKPVATAIRQQLVEQGYLSVRKDGRKATYALTEAGRAYLDTLDRPPPRPVVDESSIPEDLRKYQQAFLLMQPLLTKAKAIAKRDANAKLTKTVKQRLGLNAAVANYRRVKLAEQGYLRITKAGRSEQYELTPDGQDYLAALEQYPTFQFRLMGEALNALLAAARESLAVRDPGPAATRPAPAATLPAEEELAEAVLDEFEELRREKHGRSGLVPIHEVRQRIAGRFGPAAARHDALDEVIKHLRRTKQIDLVSINDPALATEQQLNDAIPGVHETLFYMETARAPVSSHEPL